MGGHDFLDQVSFRITCVMIAYVLREVMFCCRKCLMGGHVLVECMSSGLYLTIYCVLLKDMSFWRSFLLEGRYYRRACIAVGDVLLGYTFYRRAYLTG